MTQWIRGALLTFLGHFGNMGHHTGVEPKIGGFCPQNGWWKYWKTIFFNGWFGGFSYFLETPTSFWAHFGPSVESWAKKPKSIICEMKVGMVSFCHSSTKHGSPKTTKKLYLGKLWACNSHFCAGNFKAPKHKAPKSKVSGVRVWPRWLISSG